MGCIINNINNIDILNGCGMTIGGISNLYIMNYSKDFQKNIQIFNNSITSIDISIALKEVKFSKGSTKYSETYNFNDKKYEQVLDLELKKYDYEKRDVIDSLIKAKLIFIFKDANGKYFVFGESSGVYCNSYSGTTDVYSSGKSTYIFKFSSKSDYGLLGVGKDVVDAKLSEIDCDILLTELALLTPLTITDYGDCLAIPA
jgi:hypothetical protein